MYIKIDDTKYKVITMNTFFKRLKGLMFIKKPITNIYLFPKCSKIHTLFMRQNIDICILDKNYNISYKESNVKKNRFIIKKGYYTLEMPLNSSKSLKLNTKIKLIK